MEYMTTSFPPYCKWKSDKSNLTLHIDLHQFTKLLLAVQGIQVQDNAHTCNSIIIIIMSMEVGYTYVYMESKPTMIMSWIYPAVVKLGFLHIIIIGLCPIDS